LGIYWGWMSLVFFSTTLAGPGGIAAVELANFVALAVSTAVVAVVAFLSPALAQRVTESRLLRVAVTLAASGGTLLVLWGANADASLIAGACLVGLPEGLLLYLFVSRALRQCQSAEDVVMLFSWALLVAAALYLTVAFLGTAAGYVCAVLPLLSLAGLAAETQGGHAQNGERPDAREAEPQPSFWAATQKLPWKLLLGLAVFGIAFGLMRISASSASIEVFQESYLAHTLARAGTTVVALVLIGKLKKAYWVLSTLQLLAFTLGICSYWLPFESTAVLTVAATTAGYTCLELMLWAVLFELFLETNVAFNTLYGIVRGLVSLATLVATGFSLFVMASMAAGIVHVALLFFLLAMILVSSLLFGSRNVASLWGLERPAMAPEATDAEQVTQALAETYGLTARETEVVALLMKGRNEPFISEALFISPSTTHSHVSHIYAKIGVHSRQELLDVAERSSLTGIQS
jgi:DNA-binding CsgD family transcriptional regulator